MRKVKFQNEECYHIYNRGVDKRIIFCDNNDFKGFLKSLLALNNHLNYDQRDYLKRKANSTGREKEKPAFRYRNTGFSFSLPGFDFRPLVKIIAYCLNPNHYHLILMQLVDNGVISFMTKLGNSYTKYFNRKNNRSGHLFQGPYKSKHINSNDYLLWLSGYVNANAEIHQIAKAETYEWCSYPEYLNKNQNTFCDKAIILEQFKCLAEYREFVDTVTRETINKRKEMAKYLLE